MNGKVVVCFDDREGRTAGDSIMDPALTIPYVEGMTVTDIRSSYINKMIDSWEMREFYAIKENPISAFTEEYDINISGGWVIEESLHNILIGGNWDIGSDSAHYAMIRRVKEQIQAAAEITIE